MTTPPVAHANPADPAVLDDIRIARVHLRLGQLALARAELEDLLRRDALDANGFATLAEARWRTGDPDAATLAAVAHLDGGGTDDVAICIAAEAAALEGRADDARALMDRLPSADPATLDAIFAGIPRRAFWPSAPVEAVVEPARPDIGSPASPTQPRPAPRAAAAQTRRSKGQVDPLAELARARAELEHRPDRAFLRFALVLRYDPTLAPAVLEALHLRREPAAALLRGDAQRLLGRHLEAEAAFDAAAESLEAS